MALETLDFRRPDLSSGFLLLVPAFSLPNAPPVLADPTSQQFGMLLYQSSLKEMISQLRYDA